MGIVRRFLLDDSAGVSVEYALISAYVGLLLMGASNNIKNALRGKLDAVGQSLADASGPPQANASGPGASAPTQAP